MSAPAEGPRINGVLGITNGFPGLFFIYHKIKLMIEQDIYTKANESGEEAQKETMGLIDIGLPQSKK